MIFQVAVTDCCGTWKVQSAERVTGTVVRSHIACDGCGQRRVITCTNMAARTPLEVVS